MLKVMTSAKTTKKFKKINVTKEAAEKEPILFACSSCNRTFLPEVLAKHTKVCEKTSMKKRKTFDSSKQRLQGTELEVYANLTPGKIKKKDDTIRTKTSPAKWKEKQADLVKSMQTAKKTVNTPSVAITAKPSDHQKCPFCERFFGPKAYGRHVEWCKGQQLKFKNTNINIEARERLQVRTGYRAPLPNKVLTRDKYQPGGGRSRDPSLTKADSTKSKISEPVNRSQTFSISKSPVRGTAEKSKINQTPDINLKSPMTMRKINVETDSASTPLKTVNSSKIRSNSSSEKSDDQPETMDKLSGDKRSVGNTTIDSAYSSLTRVLSEGGGDTAKLEQSRFCHECGTQYPVAVAKFCCYCGMRRIAI